MVNTFNERGLQIFGPTKEAAQLEGSKVFSKEFMKRHNIPTADFTVFDTSDADCIEKAKKLIRENKKARVVKADGLAAGKGVTVCKNIAEADWAVERIVLRRAFGSAGNKFIIENKLSGEELSILAFVDGETVLPMLSSQDYKQIYEEDKGPNTGGMGAYAPVPFMSDKLLQSIYDVILMGTVKGLKKEGIVYKGVLYAGLMIIDGVIQVLEFNCRFGDPETQPLLYLLKSDLYDIMEKTNKGTLKDIKIDWNGNFASCIVLASDGYPGTYGKGLKVSGLEELHDRDDIKVFHAGTKLVDGDILTNGGRVFGVTSSGVTLREALDNAYKGVEKISFKGMYYRKDIGFRAFKDE
ncbi:phosphoribosylamine--glycine ligase [candidate division KSB1 bacterium]